MAGYIGSKSSVTLVDGITKNGGTLEGDLSFGDSDKAIFGAGSDLQIYHDGTHSVIKDAGTGNLKYQAASRHQFENVDGSKMYIQLVGDTVGQEYVQLRYNNATKLSTTSTGIQVTGAASTDGIKITNPLSGSFYNAKLEFTRDGTSGGAKIQSERNSAGGVGMSFNYTANNTAEVNATYTKAMTIDSSGNLLVGTSSSTSGTADGLRVIPDDFMAFTTNRTDAGDRLVLLNRQASDGTHIEFRKANATAGSISTYSNFLGIGKNDTALLFVDGSNYIEPFSFTSGSARDNAIDLGRGGARFDDIYATNGTIQTSDATEKQDIASLTATEMLVGKRISTLFKTFRWKDSVAENGDNARTHTGVIAQDVQAAFTAEGLDAGNYALFISSTWWETQTEVPAVEAVEAVDKVTETTTDEDGNEVVTVITEAVEAVEAKDAYTRTDTYDTEDEAPEGATSKTRLGIRYPELLSFVAAYNEQRFASIEARLTALEA